MALALGLRLGLILGDGLTAGELGCATTEGLVEELKNNTPPTPTATTATAARMVIVHCRFLRFRSARRASRRRWRSRSSLRCRSFLPATRAPLLLSAAFVISETSRMVPGYKHQ